MRINSDEIVVLNGSRSQILDVHRIFIDDVVADNRTERFVIDENAESPIRVNDVVVNPCVFGIVVNLDAESSIANDNIIVGDVLASGAQENTDTATSSSTVVVYEVVSNQVVMGG